MVNVSKKNIYIIGLGIFILLTLVISFLFLQPKTIVSTTQKQNLPSFSRSELSRYNGTNPDEPIFIGLDGYVYDVTLGKEYYITGGAYHDIAGTDASKDLHIFGGDIIKTKYPIVGVLSTQ